MKSKSFTIKLMSMAIAAATAISSAASLSLTNTASAAETDTTAEAKSTLPSSLQNGDFESPGIQGILSATDWTYNNPEGSTLGTYHHDSDTYTVSNDINYMDRNYKRLYPDIITYKAGNAWFVTSKDIFDDISDNKFYWETTDYNQRVELALGTQGMGSYFGGEDEDLKKLYANATASSGKQFAELVPEKKSSLYQSISTEPGKVLSWSLDHRSRKNDTDIMAIFIGPKQDHLTKASDDANDLFMEMAELIENQFSKIPVGEQIGPIKLYSKKLTNEDHTVTSNSVSTTESAICTEEWRCWIVKSDTRQWYNYSGTYTVPEGQKETTLAFTAMTSGRTNTDTQEGNCLDNIRLGELYPLTLTSMPGGTGSMESTDQGSAAVNVDGNTTNNNSKTQLYEKNKTVTITAKPAGNYIFTGAIVNGENIGVDEFTKNEDTYTHTVTMNQTYNVVLTFAQIGYITYDANGGELNLHNTNNQSIYTHKFETINETLTTIPTATYDNKKFLGWRLFAANKNGEQEEVYSELIPANHSVTYIPAGSDAQIKISWNNNNPITLSASEEDAVLLLAVYEHNLSVTPMTRYIGEASYREGDDTGGTVTVVKNPNEGQSGSSCAITAGEQYTITVSPKSGFKFDNLYYRDADGRTIALSVTNGSYSSTFSSNRDIKVYAEFSEIAIDPHYAFVPEGKDSSIDEILDESFVKNPSDKAIDGYSGKYGGDEYGNTISTGFFTTRQFSTPEKPSGIWTIQIPENGTYFKIPDGNAKNIGDLNLDKSKMLVDSPNVQYNRGTIYAVQNTGGANNLKIQVFVGTDTTIAGEGNVQFGLIIDNLYAPNATAGFRETDDSDVSDGIIALDDTNSIYSKQTDGYDHNEDTLSGKTSSEPTEATATID